MKRTLVTICLLIAGHMAIAQESAQTAAIQVSKESVGFGAKISPEGAVEVAALSEMMTDKTEMKATVKGKVAEVCQKKGCWITLENQDGSTMRVTFKDYAFFMPKHISGREVVISGLASVETTDIETLQHYAEDAGKTKAEISKITEPKKELTFEAEGVLLY